MQKTIRLFVKALFIITVIACLFSFYEGDFNWSVLFIPLIDAIFLALFLIMWRIIMGTWDITKRLPKQNDEIDGILKKEMENVSWVYVIKTVVIVVIALMLFFLSLSIVPMLIHYKTGH